MIHAFLIFQSLDKYMGLLDSLESFYNGIFKNSVLKVLTLQISNLFYF